MRKEPVDSRSRLQVARQRRQRKRKQEFGKLMCQRLVAGGSLPPDLEHRYQRLHCWHKALVAKIAEASRRAYIQERQNPPRFATLADYQAHLRLLRPPIVHAPPREYRPKPRGSRSHRARAPARPSDEPDPEPPDLVVTAPAVFWRDVAAWKAGA
jgi:hypothetical protein